jgi:hypothetical protein
MHRSGYVAHVWEVPRLTIALFGMRAATPEAYARYEAAGIPGQMEDALAGAEGLLAVRYFEQPDGGVMLQYWRSHEDLARFARRAPHRVWWQWRVANQGLGLSFYHEVYQCRAAEAIYEIGVPPVGPATFTTTSPVAAGEGRSAERQRRFAEAAATRGESDV